MSDCPSFTETTVTEVSIKQSNKVCGVKYRERKRKIGLWELPPTQSC